MQRPVLNITHSIGMILLVLFLVLLALGYLGVWSVPAVALGVVALAAAIALFCGV